MKRSITITIGLLLVAASSSTAEPGFFFTVTSDMRNGHTTFGDICQAINANHGGPGAFHVTIGDMDPIPPNRAVVDTYFGSSAIWYPLIGNHEEETGEDMEWLRNEYDNGHGVRTPLSDPSMTNADGPVGTQRVCYTWDYGDAHFISLNIYWNGGPNEGIGNNITGDDTATDGDIVPELYDWLVADLADNTKPFVFVFGHEPAFPYHRHIGDSLDKYPANRDALWSLLEAEGVQVFFCGHTHYYSKHQGDVDHIGEVWQLDVGNVGVEPAPDPPYEGQTYFHVEVDQDYVIVDVYRNEGTDTVFWVESVTLVCGGDEHCDDYNPCTDDTCVDQQCVFTPNDANSCDDNLYCTGVETCLSGSCETTGDPCQADELCDEDTDTCVSVTQTVYDFTGITSPSSTHSAEDGEIDVDESMIEGATFPTRRGSGISGWDLWGEASSAEYAALLASDDNRYQGAFAGLGDNAAMIFEFIIAEDPAAIAQIDVSVEVGRSDSTRLGWVYAWNYDTGSYSVLGTQSGAEDQVVSASITSTPGDYVEGGTGQLTIFVVNEFSGAWIYVDDISVTVIVPSGCQGDEDCDDDVGCTDDTCVAGTCVFTPNDTNCDDTLYCNGAETCDALLDCQAGTAVDCDDSIGCTDDSCNEGTDSCDNVPNDSLCDNGLYCDGVETCDALLDCQAGTAVDCDDLVGCTDDSCNEGTDSCDNVPNDSLCDNGLYCDGAETCDALLDCQAGTAVDCDDLVGCTDDSCNEGTDSCDNVPNDSLCDNGLYCDGAETCDALLDCQAGTAVDCDDLVGCTDDSCNEGTDSCDNVPNDSLCDNGLYCDGAETCDALLDCQAGTAVDCDDLVGCTDDSCNEGTDSCDNVPDDANCDDGLYCNGDETCDAVADCQAGTPVKCKDGVSCTDDSCNEDTDSCDNVPNDANCDDGLWCTGDHRCDRVLNCVPVGWPPCKDGVKCTIDNCDEGTHTCDNVPDDAVCDDGLWCNGAETCDAVFGCLNGPPPCRDGVPCTVDNCDEGSHTCDNVPDDTWCDDGEFCNGAEWCDVVSDCQPGSDPCVPGQLCDEDGDRCLGAEGVFSCRDHGPAGRLCVDLGTNGGIEPRSGGIDELEIDVTDAFGFAGGVTVICLNAGDVSASVSGTSVEGNTVTVSFSPALPDQDACTIELDCGGSVCVRGLEGDLNLTGETSTMDATQVRVRIGQDAATAGPQWDFDTSGEVATADYSQVKARFGHTAPECP